MQLLHTEIRAASVELHSSVELGFCGCLPGYFSVGLGQGQFVRSKFVLGRCLLCDQPSQCLLTLLQPVALRDGLRELASDSRRFVLASSSSRSPQVVLCLEQLAASLRQAGRGILDIQFQQ